MAAATRAESVVATPRYAEPVRTEPAQPTPNVEGAFAADSTRLQAGCEVLLVDDIYTTGATARECARVLRRAGARKVWVATLARAQRPQVALWDDAALQSPQGFGERGAEAAESFALFHSVDTTDPDADRKRRN